MVLQQKILTISDLNVFRSSDTYRQLVDFIDQLNTSVKGVTCTAPINVSYKCGELIAILNQIEEWVSDFPPQREHKSRFGNPAYRDWYDHLEHEAPLLVQRLVSSTAATIPPVTSTHSTSPTATANTSTHISELCWYLTHCFGDRQRIDYGTGHELTFVLFLFGLFKLQLVTADDYRALVLRVFTTYLRVMRTLQRTYWLEPAGSHGVWGLDDYHFLPFLWGSAQLIEHKHIKPKCVHYAEYLEGFAKDYLYLQCIQWILNVKVGTLSVHSPLLNDISGVRTWSKVNQGLFKMYQVEVLGKLPIMQHIHFGTLFPWTAASSHSENADSKEPLAAASVHPHDVNSTCLSVPSGTDSPPHCCVPRLPSVFASSSCQQEKYWRIPQD